MNRILTLINNINKKIFLFILLPFYSSADTVISNSVIGYYKFPQAPVYTRYTGLLPLPNGEKGIVVKGCTSWTNGRCDPSDVWGAGFFMPGGGVFNISLNRPVSPGGNDSSNKCYFRGAWHLSLSANSLSGRLDRSEMLSGMNETVSNGVWSSWPSTVVTSPLIINKRCSDITPEWISKSGTQLAIPASSIPVYANVYAARTYAGAMGPPSGVIGVGAPFLLLRYSTWFQYTSLICTSEAISDSTCIQGYQSNADMGLVNQRPPVIPKECLVNGNNIIEIGTVSKSDYTGASGKVDMSVRCSGDATVVMRLVNEKLSNNGIDIKMSINNQGTEQRIPLEGNQVIPFFINAEVMSISASTVPGKYEMNNILVVSYY